MHFSGVLIEARRHLVFGLFHRHAVDMVDSFADLVIGKAEQRARQHRIIIIGHDHRTGIPQSIGLKTGRKIGDMRLQSRTGGVGLAHHHPAHIIQHHIAMLVEPARADIDHAGFAVGVFFQADHFGCRRQRITGIDGGEKAAGGIAEIGHRIDRNIGHGLAEHDVEHQQIIDRRLRIADGAGKFIRGLHRKPSAIECGIERDIAAGHAARGCMGDHIAQPEILEKASRSGFGNAHACVSLKAPFSTTLLHCSKRGCVVF